MRCLLYIGALAFVAAGCEADPAGTSSAAPGAPPRPVACREVASGDLAAVVAGATEGETLCLAPGRWQGPLHIERKLTLWGPRDAVVVVGGPGSVIKVTAAGTVLSGFTIDGIGGRFDQLDAAVHVTADDVRVEGLAVVNSVFGVLVEKSARANIVGNHIVGDAATTMGMRGDTVRLWETYDSVVADNLVEDGRDIVIWYSGRNQITRNRVLRGRYGTHFMYAHDNAVVDNAYVDGVVGVFIMYSRRVRLEGNLVLNASGASGMAIGVKDSGDIFIEGNILVHDQVGVYIDGTPSQLTEVLRISGNVIRQCTTGIHLHTTPRRTSIEDNDLSDNARQVAADAGTQPQDAIWRSNYFDDYAGYDIDGDGVGDLPHRAESASEDLVAQHTALAFFRGSPALALVDMGSRLLPLWKPRVLLDDPSPRMNARPLPELRTIALSSGARPPEVDHAD